MAENNERAVQTPRADLIRRSAAFLIEHAEHEFYYNTSHGQLGVFAACATCCAAIHHPDYESLVRHERESADARTPQLTKCRVCGYLVVPDKALVVNGGYIHPSCNRRAVDARTPLEILGEEACEAARRAGLRTDHDIRMFQIGWNMRGADARTPPVLASTICTCGHINLAHLGIYGRCQSCGCETFRSDARTPVPAVCRKSFGCAREPHDGDCWPRTPVPAKEPVMEYQTYKTCGKCGLTYLIAPSDGSHARLYGHPFTLAPSVPAAKEEKWEAMAASVMPSFRPEFAVPAADQPPQETCPLCGYFLCKHTKKESL